MWMAPPLPLTTATRTKKYTISEVTAMNQLWTWLRRGTVARVVKIGVDSGAKTSEFSGSAESQPKLASDATKQRSDVQRKVGCDVIIRACQLNSTHRLGYATRYAHQDSMVNGHIPSARIR